MLNSKSAPIDWAATGTMIQGIGTLIGAIAVIIAAAIGGGTLRSWRRQQMLQRHMDLADRIFTAAVKAKQEINSVRSPWKDGSELHEAGKTLEANGLAKSSFSDAEWRRMESAQVSLDRINRCHSTWSDLEALKHSAYVHFGAEISEKIETILHQVHIIRVDALAYAEGFGDNQEFRKKLMNSLSWGRPTGEIDEMGKTIDDAVNGIEERFKPLLRDAANATQKIIMEAVAKSIFSGPLRILGF